MERFPCPTGLPFRIRCIYDAVRDRNRGIGLDNNGNITSLIFVGYIYYVNCVNTGTQERRYTLKHILSFFALIYYVLTILQH